MADQPLLGAVPRRPREPRVLDDLLQLRQGQLTQAAGYDGQPFPTALRDLGLTSNQVWGLTKTDKEWSGQLEAALMATRRNDLRPARPPRTCTAVFAVSVGGISGSGWPGTAEFLTA
jgi:hypothetical protein